jgi:hypothetical protein
MKNLPQKGHRAIEEEEKQLELFDGAIIDGIYPNYVTSDRELSVYRRSTK